MSSFIRLHIFAVTGALLLSATATKAEIVEKIVKLPVRAVVDGQAVERDMTLTIVRDDARAKGPFMILSHGRAPTAEGRASYGRAVFREQARHFAQQGFVVFMPTRIGYGVTGGPDLESSGSCKAKDYEASLRPAVAQVAATAKYAREQAFVDGGRGVLIGTSVGGFTTIAAAAAGVPGVRAAINFAGGAGGDPKARPGEPCQPERIGATYGGFASRAHIPTLWLYASNDRFWGADYPQRWFAQYTAAGGKGEFVALRPTGEDGHSAFTKDMDGWKPSVSAFLKKAGF